MELKIWSKKWPLWA